MITQIYTITTVKEALGVIKAGADYLGIVPQQKSEEPNSTISEEMTFAILNATRNKKT